MATAEQIRANRENAKKSTGPRSKEGKETSRFNGLKHGLRAEQVVIPGEDPADFEAERDAWFEDWKPRSHTRAVLVERAAVAAWRLRRCVRAEAARLHAPGGDAAYEFDTAAQQRVEVALHLLPRDPAAAVERLRSDASGLDCLVGLWEGLAEAAVPGRWTSGADHHGRLLALLGHPAGADAEGTDVAGASRALIRSDGADPAGRAASATLRALCLARAEGLRRERSACWDPATLRRRSIDSACAPDSKEAQLLLRYEMAHEQSLRSSLRQLMALERSGADLAEEPRASEEGEAEVPATGDEAGISGVNRHESRVCEELASVVEVSEVPSPSPRRPGAAATPGRGPIANPGRPAGLGRPVVVDPGPIRV